MLKIMLALALAGVPTLATAPAVTWTNGTVNSEWPPLRYEGETVAIVAFVDDVQTICGTMPPPYQIIACASQEKKLIVMPNPCAPKFRHEEYAKIICHEKGHILGWAGDHPE